jgi:hypothetical protein
MELKCGCRDGSVIFNAVWVDVNPCCIAESDTKRGGESSPSPNVNIRKKDG